MQAEEELAPCIVLAVPAGHARQEAEEARPVPRLHVPAGQTVGGAAPPVQKDPALQRSPAADVAPPKHPKPATALQGVQVTAPPTL